MSRPDGPPQTRGVPMRAWRPSPTGLGQGGGRFAVTLGSRPGAPSLPRFPAPGYRGGRGAAGEGGTLGARGPSSGCRSSVLAVCGALGARFQLQAIWP